MLGTGGLGLLARGCGGQGSPLRGGQWGGKRTPGVRHHVRESRGAASVALAVGGGRRGCWHSASVCLNRVFAWMRLVGCSRAGGQRCGVTRPILLGLRTVPPAPGRDGEKGLSGAGRGHVHGSRPEPRGSLNLPLPRKPPQFSCGRSWFSTRTELHSTAGRRHTAGRVG